MKIPMRCKLIGIAALCLAWNIAGWSAEVAPLRLEARIPLGDVKGRLDHLAIDPARQRLFVAELGNDTVGVIDLKSGRVLRTLTGFGEPQGIGYEAETDTIYVANGADGSVHLLRGDDFSSTARIDLGDDADNVRVDPLAKRVYVGFGKGALAVIDPNTRTRIATIALKAHPEGFQLDPAGSRIFVNAPRSREIAVVDRTSNRQIASWPTKGAFANFPMALDAANQRLLVVFRLPARLKVFSYVDGKPLADVAICADSDDVFLDSKRQRIYVSCGEGFLDVVNNRPGLYERIGRLETISGARTSLFVPDLDRLFVAVRATEREPAAVWLFRPAP